MLHFGTKENTLVKQNTIHKCENCDSLKTTFLFVNNKYCHIWFVPIFQYEKDVYLRCKACNYLRAYKWMPLNFKFEAKELLKRTKTPIVHYAGSLMLIFIVVSFSIKFSFDSKEEKLLLQEPKVGDVYTYKASRSNYTLLKVLRVSKDSVFVSENKYITNKLMSLYEMDSDEFYSNETYGIGMNNLLQMHEEGEIMGVERKKRNLQTEIFKRLP
jgi:hypothetical protein